MSVHKYLLLNKKNEENAYNRLNRNLKSLDYETNRTEKIYKFVRFNSYSIKNIFNPKKSNNKNISDFPLKTKLNQKRNTTCENQLIIPDNIFVKKESLEKKPSDKSIENENIYKSNSISLEPFSPRRVLTIPTQNYHFGYAVDEKGNMELLDDPDIMDKFNGTKNNSVGPDRYNIIPSPRKRLIIDWSKDLDDKNILNKNSRNNIKNIKLLSKLDDLFLTNVMKNSRRNYNNEAKTELTKNNNLRIKDWKKEEEYIRDKKLKYEQQQKEEKALVGPGSYNLSDEFIISPKKNKFQNFGSSKSRNMDSIKKEKNNIIEDNIKYYFLIDNNRENKSENNDKKNLYKNSKFFTYKLKAQLLKEKSMFDKKKIEENLGPGRYEIEVPKIRKENKIENFGSLEKRKFHYNNKEGPWDCSYIPLEDWTKKFKKNIEIEKKKENIFKYFDDFSDNIGHKIQEMPVQKPEEEIKKIINYNKYRPGFGSNEPRFYIFKSDINIFNGVGSYNLIPMRKNKAQYAPFIYSSKRHNVVKKDNNPQLGPGTFNKFDTFFQWNKKSFNVKIKDRIDKFKQSDK